MPSALRIDETFPSLPDTVRSFVAFQRIGPNVDERIEELRRIVAAQCSEADAFVHAVWTSLPAILSGNEETFDAAVEHLESLEAHGAEEIARGRKHGDRVLKGLGAAAPALRAALPPLVLEVLGKQRTVLETIRDARWAIMGARAERFPSKPVGQVHGEGGLPRRLLTA
jgi:hypothetical protein